MCWIFQSILNMYNFHYRVHDEKNPRYKRVSQMILYSCTYRCLQGNLCGQRKIHFLGYIREHSCYDPTNKKLSLIGR